MDISILQFFNGNGNLFLDRFVSYLSYGWTWIPLYITLFVLVVKNNKTMAQVCIITLCALLCIMFAGGLSDLFVKPFTHRLRPCDDPTLSSALTFVEGYNVSGYSFFSSHAANTFSIAMFFSILIRNRLLSITLFLWALTNAWTRLYLAVHYPSDVAVGMIWGCLVGIFVYIGYYKIYIQKTSRSTYVSTHYTSTGYEIDDIDACLSIISITLLGVLLYSIF